MFIGEKDPARAFYVVITGPVMESIAMKEPRLLLNIIRLLSDRLKESMTLIESLALKEIPQRIASFLIHALKGEDGQGMNQLELTVTQRELAKILGATPKAEAQAEAHVTLTGGETSI